MATATENRQMYDLTNQFLGLLESYTKMPKPERRRFLKYLCDGYASASFGYECDQCRSLDEADQMKYLIDHVAKSLGLPEFDHYTLEEVYTRPVQKGEDAAKRASDLISRCRSSRGWDKGPWVAQKLAKEVSAFYQKGDNRTFWNYVHAIIEKENKKL